MSRGTLHAVAGPSDSPDNKWKTPDRLYTNRVPLGGFHEEGSYYSMQPPSLMHTYLHCGPYQTLSGAHNAV